MFDASGPVAPAVEFRPVLDMPRLAAVAVPVASTEGAGAWFEPVARLSKVHSVMTLWALHGEARAASEPTETMRAIRERFMVVDAGEKP